jgi:putative sigma-54 modulation protein
LVAEAGGSARRIPRSLLVQVKISARHGHLSESAQSVIREKAQKLLHYFERLTIIEVTVDLQEDAKTVEVLASAEHKHDFVAREANGEMQVALDMALDKVIHQLRKYKEKIQDHRRTPSAGDGATTGRP